MLTSAIRKYGKSNFSCELIENCNSREDLDKKEQYWIKYFDSTNAKIGYNITEGGGGVSGYSHNENSKVKISLARKGKICINDSFHNYYIFENEVQKYLDMNYQLGRLPFDIKDPAKKSRKISEAKKGFILVNNGIDVLRISEKDLSKYLDQGYARGKISNKKIIMSKGTDIIEVFRHEVRQFEELGYKRGKGILGEQERIRKMLQSRSYVMKPETIEKIKKARAKQIMKFAVNDGVNTFYVFNEQLDDYLKKGYKRGRALKPLNISNDIKLDVINFYSSGKSLAACVDNFRPAYHVSLAKIKRILSEANILRTK